MSEACAEGGAVLLSQLLESLAYTSQGDELLKAIFVKDGQLISRIAAVVSHGYNSRSSSTSLSSGMCFSLCLCDASLRFLTLESLSCVLWQSQVLSTLATAHSLPSPQDSMQFQSLAALYGGLSAQPKPNVFIPFRQRCDMTSDLL